MYRIKKGVSFISFLIALAYPSHCLGDAFLQGCYVNWIFLHSPETLARLQITRKHAVKTIKQLEELCNDPKNHKSLKEQRDQEFTIRSNKYLHRTLDPSVNFFNGLRYFSFFSGPFIKTLLTPELYEKSLLTKFIKTPNTDLDIHSFALREIHTPEQLIIFCKELECLIRNIEENVPPIVDKVFQPYMNEVKKHSAQRRNDIQQETTSNKMCPA